MGIAHSLMEDDSYDGYHIPKGSVIMPNVWLVSFALPAAVSSSFA
jgi:hypothetical protein